MATTGLHLIILHIASLCLVHSCEIVCVSMDFFQCSVCYLSCQDSYSKFDSCTITKCVQYSDQDSTCLESQQFPLNEANCISSCCLFDYEVSQFSDESVQQCRQDNTQYVLTVVGIVIGIFACIGVPIFVCVCLGKLLTSDSCRCCQKCGQNFCQMIAFLLTCGYCCQCLSSNEIENNIENNNNKMGQSTMEPVIPLQKWTQDTYLREKLQEGSLCSICLDTNGQVFTQCNHFYHTQCIWDWFQKKQSCPNCLCTQINPIRYYCKGCLSSYMIIDLRDFQKYFEVEQELKDNFCPNCK